jgi:hypothetical protein
VRAHLRACDACREWDAARPARGRELCALPPALASAASSLWSWIGGAAAGAPGSIGAAAASKVVTGVAVIAAGTTPIAQREMVAHHVVRPAPAKRQPVVAKRAPVVTKRESAVAKREPVAAKREPALVTRQVIAPKARARPTAAPDRQDKALPVRSPSPEPVRAGAPRGRDGAPGGRRPAGHDVTAPAR